VFDKVGNLYRASTDGGMVYQLAPPAKPGDPCTESVLYVFPGNTQGDGVTPSGELVMDSVDNRYGATASEGTGNCVLRGIWVGLWHGLRSIATQGKGGPWAETGPNSFPTPNQGYLPNGDLVFDSAGNLYGATTFGGG
jgi:hypothetical protein